MQRVLRWVIIGVVLDLLVAGVLGFLAIREHNNRVQLQHEERVSQCWDAVLADATINLKLHPSSQEQSVIFDHALRCVQMEQKRS